MAIGVYSTTLGGQSGISSNHLLVLHSLIQFRNKWALSDIKFQLLLFFKKKKGWDQNLWHPQSRLWLHDNPAHSTARNLAILIRKIVCYVSNDFIIHLPQLYRFVIG